MNRRQLLTYAMYGLALSALPPSRAAARGKDERFVVRCVIHPAIGVCRVGNSPTGMYVGPEVPGHHPAPQGGFKDASGRVLRQAARFRIFGLDQFGQVVMELTADNADITWRVHLANKKGAWYVFRRALDIPEALAGAEGPLVVGRRNASVAGADRTSLVIDPGPREITGRNANQDGGEARCRFDGGRFFGVEVPLGELRTDEAGRLLVLGGHGASGSPLPDFPATSVTDNELWYDDTSDGPVDAIVRVGSLTLQAEGAWVVVAPPNYAPGIISNVTMYDVVYQAATSLAPVPERPSFARQIYPLLERQVRQQWVNVGILADNGWNAAGDFTRHDLLSALASRSPESQALRGAVFARFRDPAYVSLQPGLLPANYGDVPNLPPSSPRQYLALLPAQYEWLRQWAAGEFDEDWPADGLVIPSCLDDIPLAERPAALDRAALDECLGGPFVPGYEMTWVLRVPLMYSAPFRLRRREGPEPDWGNSIRATRALAPDGPLSASGPGDLTRWLAVPWQTDAASCRFAFDPTDGAYLPAFWPARVPNHVLTGAAYDVVMNASAPLAERQMAFAERRTWLPAPSSSGSNSFLNAFVQAWSRQRFVVQRPGPGDSSFPGQFWVEDIA